MTIRGRRATPSPNAVWAILAGLLATGAGANVMPSSDRPIVKPLVVTNPDWTRKPTGYELSEFYPPAAFAMKLNGFATVDCSVVVDGTLEDCRLVTEEPSGSGFGDAALKMTPFFAMRPKLVDGSPVAGARVIIPIRFKLPSTPEPPTAGSPPPTPRALMLARRVIAAQHGEASLRRYVDQYVESFAAGLEQPSGGVLSPEVEATIKKAKDDAYADIPVFLESDAIIVASSLNERQLETIAAFLESPAGQAWSAGVTSNEAAFRRLNEDFGKTLFKRLCSATPCTPRPIRP